MRRSDRTRKLANTLHNIPLMWSEALRALLCMLPMLVAAGFGKTAFLVALGQGGFLFSTLFLPRRLGGRFLMGSLLIAFGLGFYLIGGVVAPNPWVAVFVTFLVCFNLSFLSGWKVGGPLALTLIMVYTSGLNAGSPEKVTDNFILFLGVFLWSLLISLLPFWKPIDPPPVDTKQSAADLAEQGSRMGIGTSLALAISYMFGFAKIGWAPSAVGNVVRYDKTVSKKRAWARSVGTIGGAILATIALLFATNLIVAVCAGAFFAVLNGLFKKTKLGAMPLFYTATILILYSANDLSSSATVTLERVAFNLVGIAIGVLVVIYPFPRLMKVLHTGSADKTLTKQSKKSITKV